MRVLKLVVRWYDLYEESVSGWDLRYYSHLLQEHMECIYDIDDGLLSFTRAAAAPIIFNSRLIYHRLSRHHTTHYITASARVTAPLFPTNQVVSFERPQQNE